MRAPMNTAKRPSENGHSHRSGPNDRFKRGGEGGGARFGSGSRNGGDRFGGGSSNGGFGAKKAIGENAKMVQPDWGTIELSAFKKDFYQPNPIVSQRSSLEIDAYRAEHSITIRGRAPNPIMNFDEVNMPDYVMNEIRRQGYEKPTPIQAQGWPIALSGSNMVGIAKTGYVSFCFVSFYSLNKKFRF